MRSNGIDIISGEGLKNALAGVDCIIDAASGPSPDQESATKFFTTAARNLQEFGAQAGVKKIIVSVDHRDRQIVYCPAIWWPKLLTKKQVNQDVVPAI